MRRSSCFALILAAAVGLTLPQAQAPAALAWSPERADAKPIPGPRRTIAVGAIEAGGGFDAGDDWDVGNALSSMLAKALSDSGQFVVVERTSLAEVLNEQQLQASKVSGGSTGGVRMISAQYLVVGSVTEFGSASRGGGLSVGGLGLGNGATGGAALTRQGGKVKIDLRLLDARTGEVVRAFSVSRKATRTGLGLTGAQNGVSAGANVFSRTPLGDASRRAIEDAVGHIAEALAQSAWEGRVVAFDGGSVIVNAGAEAGLAAGDRLRIERLGRVLTDPGTGAILSEERSTLGEVVIRTTEPKIARGDFVPASATMPERGDFVVFSAQPR